MFTKLPHQNMGKSNLGWLQSHFHFSFAAYRNPKNINFGVLRVLNDDIIAPQSGFDTHPHANMEIITYIIDGELTHKDSMHNAEVLCRGEVQYMSTGSGITHSEYNNHDTKSLHLLQIWILPPQKNLASKYGSYRYSQNQAQNKLLHIASPINGGSMIEIYQDVNIYVAQLQTRKQISYKIKKNRQIYYVQIEGQCQIGDVILEAKDGCEITDEQILKIHSLTNAHLLFIEMVKSI